MGEVYRDKQIFLYRSDQGQTESKSCYIIPLHSSFLIFFFFDFFPPISNSCITYPVNLSTFSIFWIRLWIVGWEKPKYSGPETEDENSFERSLQHAKRLGGFKRYLRLATERIPIFSRNGNLILNEMNT